jgi:hypothetical protein
MGSSVTTPGTGPARAAVETNVVVGVEVEAEHDERGLRRDHRAHGVGEGEPASGLPALAGQQPVDELAEVRPFVAVEIPPLGERGGDEVLPAIG